MGNGFAHHGGALLRRRATLHFVGCCFIVRFPSSRSVCRAKSRHGAGGKISAKTTVKGSFSTVLRFPTVSLSRVVAPFGDWLELVRRCSVTEIGTMAMASKRRGCPFTDSRSRGSSGNAAAVAKKLIEGCCSKASIRFCFCCRFWGTEKGFFRTPFCTPFSTKHVYSRRDCRCRYFLRGSNF